MQVKRIFGIGSRVQCHQDLKKTPETAIHTPAILDVKMKANGETCFHDVKKMHCDQTTPQNE